MIFGVPVQELLAFVLMGLGLVFLIGSAIGMLRLPDFYSRVHASGNRLAVYNGFTDTSAKIIIIFLFVFIGNPIGSHILTKTAYKTGHVVWTKPHQKDAEMQEAEAAAREGES